MQEFVLIRVQGGKSLGLRELDLLFSLNGGKKLGYLKRNFFGKQLGE